MKSFRAEAEPRRMRVFRGVRVVGLGLAALAAPALSRDFFQSHVGRQPVDAAARSAYRGLPRL